MTRKLLSDFIWVTRRTGSCQTQALFDAASLWTVRSQGRTGSTSTLRVHGCTDQEPSGPLSSDTNQGKGVTNDPLHGAWTRSPCGVACGSLRSQGSSSAVSTLRRDTHSVGEESWRQIRQYAALASPESVAGPSYSSAALAVQSHYDAVAPRQSHSHHNCDNSAGPHRSADPIEINSSNQMSSDNASSSRGGSVPASQSQAPTVIGVTTLQSGSGFKKTFFKRHLPSPPATAFSSPQG